MDHHHHRNPHPPRHHHHHYHFHYHHRDLPPHLQRLPPPPPLPLPPPFSDDGGHNSFPPLRHLPPPPPMPPPSSSSPFPLSHPPHISHQPPPNSLSSHHHHHHQHYSPLVYDHSPPPPPPRPPHRNDVSDDFAFGNRRRFDLREPLPPPPRVPPFPVILDRQVNFNDYLSPPPLPPPPPPFVDAVDRFSRNVRSPMIAEEFHIDNRIRLRRFDDDRMNLIDRDELHRVRVDDERRNVNVGERDDFRGDLIFDERRSVNVFEREEEELRRRIDQQRSMEFVDREEIRHDGIHDDWRSFKDVEREELLHQRIDERMRIMDGIVRDELLRHQTIVEKGELFCDRMNDDQGIMNDGLHRDVYHPEVLFRDFELGSGGNEFVRGEIVDEAPPMRDENVSFNDVRHGRFDIRRDVARSPVKFQGRGVEVEELFSEFYEDKMKHGRCVGRGDLRERLRGDLHEWDNHSPTSPRKKSAFLRLQPAIQHTSTFRNRLDSTTPSPHKGKMSNGESSDHRSNGERAARSIDLDVSFKSNALVAKAIVATPSSSGVDGNETVGGSGLGTRIDGESPLKAGRSRNGGIGSPVPRKQRKQSENKVIVSPSSKNVGFRKIAEVRDNSSELSSSGCSSLSGGGSTCSKTSLEGEVLSKDDKRGGLSKESSPSVRRKRKAVNPVSRLSGSVQTKNTGTGAVVAYSDSRPSSGFMSADTSALHSEVSPSCLEGETLSKDEKGAGLSKEASPSVRKKQKAVNPVSLLSASVPTNITGTGADVSCSVSCPSSGFVSEDTSVLHSQVSPSTYNDIRLTQDHKVSNTEKLSVSDCSTTVVQEDVVHPISEMFFRKKIRKERLQSLSDAQGPPEPRCVQDDPGISNSEDDIPISIEKCSLDINAKKGGRQDQESALVLVGNASVEGPSEPIAISIGDSTVNRDICFGRMNTFDSLASTNSFTCQLDSSSMTENMVDLSSSVVNVYEPHGLSLQSSIIGQQFGDVHLDEVVLSHSGDEMRSKNSRSIDVSSEDTVSVGCVEVMRISDIELTNDIQEQECIGAGSIFVNDEARERREDVLEPCVSMEGDVCHVAVSSVQEDIFPLYRKRKAGIEPDILDSETSESSCDMTMSRGNSNKDSTLSTERHNPSVSSSPCCTSESDILNGNGSIPKCFEGKFVIGQVCDLDPKDDPCSCSKRRKTFPSDSLFSGTSVPENCDLRASANALKSVAGGPLYSVNCCEQAPGGSSNTLLSSEDVVEPSSCLRTVRTVFGDSSIAEVLPMESHSSVEVIANVSAKQSSYSAESGCDKTDDGHLMGAGNCLGNELIGSESECEVAKNDPDNYEHCIRPHHAMDLNDRPLVTVMECESNITGKGNLASVSDFPLCCAKSTQEMVSNQLAVLDSPSNVGSLGVCPQVSSTVDISDPAVHANTCNKLCGHVKKNQSLKSLGALISPSTLVREGNQMNMKPGISAPARNQPFTPKTASVPSKPAKKGVAVSSAMSRQFSWRNTLTHGKTTPSSQVSPAPTFANKALATIPSKPRTWHRTDNLAASSVIVKKPSLSTPPPQRAPYRNCLKVQDTSYIRKGNSLVRNPSSSTAARGPSVFSTSIVQAKPIDTNKTGKLKCSGTINSSESPDCLMTGGQEALIDVPKSPKLPSSEKTSDCSFAFSGDSTSSLQVSQSELLDNKSALKAAETALNSSGNSLNVPGRSLQDAGNLSDGVCQASNVKRVVYIKRKSNQLIAASTPGLSPPVTSGRILDNKLMPASDTSYYKRRKHQLIRASSESNIPKMAGTTSDSSNSRPQKALTLYSGRSSTKRVSKRVKSSKASLVWKLGDPKSSNKAVEPLRSRQLLSHLLPWKRATYWRSVWCASASISNCASSTKTRKFLSPKKQAVLYVRSGRGFSLKRSKVISLAGSLKWSKSMEKRSKKVDEDAAVAVAESAKRLKLRASDVCSETGIGKISTHKSVHSVKVRPGERIFRVGVFRYRMDPSRRTLQRIPDEEAPDSTTSKTGKFARKTYIPKRLLIGTNEYVRIGNGNQLVRDPKKRTRILASEKVRWSLHTARMRLAKKRRFCQFFTRFGQCNKSEGKCPYIHDPSKIAVCTKFLKGLCADPNCKLTHKVLPERMPDCSFFLQGLCSNESCPYRHVTVNPKASICESFLRGYCAEGNKCQKKHSYLCPEFEATGSCPQGSSCKLYHPKKGMGQKGKISEDQRNIRGRYFDTGLTAAAAEPEIENAIPEKDAAPENSGIISEGDCGDYISLGVSDDEAEESECLNSEVMYVCEFDALISPPSDDIDELAKPLCILDTH